MTPSPMGKALGRCRASATVRWSEAWTRVGGRSMIAPTRGRGIGRIRRWGGAGTGGFYAASQRPLIRHGVRRDTFPHGEGFGALPRQRMAFGCGGGREVFTLLRSDPSSVTAFAVTPSPWGKALGRCRARGWLLGAEDGGGLFTLLRSDPSSVSCADTFPHGEGFGVRSRFAGGWGGSLNKQKNTPELQQRFG